MKDWIRRRLAVMLTAMALRQTQAVEVLREEILVLEATAARMEKLPLRLTATVMRKAVAMLLRLALKRMASASLEKLRPQPKNTTT